LHDYQLFHKILEMIKNEKTSSSIDNKATSNGFTGGRPIKAVSGNRIKVRAGDGSVYECDRYCPHKKVDLVSWGQVLGNTLVCTKHNWNFSLDGTGMNPKGRTLSPCQVNDW
jgi:nitrite reductase/ring-hydroxylating ferredoxin subunit